MKLKKILFVILGCIGLGMGAVGAVVPVLPAFPFLMLALFSFSRSSERLHQWFLSTKLYKNNLESYLSGRGMTWKAKIRVMLMITILMSIGFTIMFRRELYIPCIVLGFIWVFHILYFCLKVKTIHEPPKVSDVKNKEIQSSCERL